jgi:hypothetical protein
MCSRFRSAVGKEWKPCDTLPVDLADEVEAAGVWAGFATSEKLEWWLRKPGHRIVQTTEPVIAIAERADDTGELIWADIEPSAHLLFVLEPPPAGKDYRLARLVTKAATAAQAAYFRHDRFPLLGHLERGGLLKEISPSDPPPPEPRLRQESLF